MPASQEANADGAQAFASVHTKTLPEFLRQLGATLLVSTYQAGKLIAARVSDGVLNTHFMDFSKPMGLAVAADRVYVGTQHAIREYRNVPDTAKRLKPAGMHDAVYVLRNVHVTGNIDVHEMAFVNQRCVYVNTAFSCLCALDTEHSFVPIWRPRFVSGYSPEDRCHLNGLGLADGRPKFLTALGATDTREGWRANKRDGGVLIDFESAEVIAGGLSMPHSPRWHNGRLWVLESGKGSLGVVDLASGRVETIAKLPGFTRGLAMAGSLAFIGMSQLREKHAFTGIEVTEEVADRASGVWVVHLESGKVVGFLKFSAAVQEIFAVELVPGVRYPEFIDEGNEMLDSVFVLPDEALKQVRFSGVA